LNALYTFALGADSSPASGPLDSDSWHDLALSWDFRSKTCRASIDGRAERVLPQLKAISEGANYLRFRVLGDEPNHGGLLVESVEAKIDLSVPAESAVPR